MAPVLKQEVGQRLKKDEVQKPVFVPEYDYSRFFLNVPKSVSGDIVWEIMEIAKQICSVSPEKTATVLFEKKEVLETQKRTLESDENGKKMLEEGRIKLVLIGEDRDVWAQDYWETTGGVHPVLLRGLPIREEHMDNSWYEYTIGGRGTADPERMFFGMGVEIRDVDVVIDGGDITKAYNTRGEALVIVGKNSIRKTMLKNGENGEGEILERYAKIFGADRAVSMEYTGGFPDNVFHLDQSVAFLPDGIAIVAIPDYPYDLDQEFVQAEIKAMEKYCKKLEEEGFRVVKISTTHKHIRRYQAYTNLIALKDEHGKTHVIMPTFMSSPSIIESKNKEILEKEGIEVHFVNDSAFKVQGNVHCLTGAISYFESEGPKREFYQKMMG